MSFIPYIPPDQQAPADRVADQDNIVQVHSIHPAVMRAHLQLYRAVMHGPGPLSRREREILAVRVSGLNDCPY